MVYGFINNGTSLVRSNFREGVIEMYSPTLNQWIKVDFESHCEDLDTQEQILYQDVEKVLESVRELGDVHKAYLIWTPTN